MTGAADRFAAATAHLSAGRFSEADPLLRQILAENPRHVDALQLLGLIEAKAGRLESGAELMERALVMAPGHPAILNNLGEVRRQQERYADAERSLRQAILSAPSFAEPHYNLGIVLRQLGRDEEAATSYRRAIELQPGHRRARFNLANLLREQGRVPAAIAEYRSLVHEVPGWHEAQLNFGNALLDAGDVADAIETYKRAFALKTSDTRIADNIGDAYSRIGDIDSARHWYGVAQSGGRNDLLRKLRADTLADPIPDSNAAIDEYRQKLAAHLAEFARDSSTIDRASAHSSGAEPPMALTYQGRDDRPIRDLYGDFFAARIPEVSPPTPAGPPHVGIVVTHGHEGVFYRCLGSLVERLDPKRLRVTIACSLAGKNVLSQVFFRREQRYLVLPLRIDEAAETIRREKFHLLHYWEIGTDSTNYFLPFLRPARVQSTTWGWPVTSGNPRVDAFVSAVSLEPPTGDTHYREKLLRLDSVPTYYERPPVAGTVPTRESLGLPTNGPLYFCPQNVRKYHPDFDAVLAEILHRDGSGQLLIIADDQQALTDRLLRRLKRNLGDAASRVTVLPRMPRERYLSVLACVDVNLDTFHYGGGANTVYDSVATGTPMVTLPGAYHRGRFAAGTFASMGISEMTAPSPSDYAEIAVGIATDRDQRRHLSEQLRRRSEVVLENRAAVRAHEEFFLEWSARGS